MKVSREQYVSIRRGTLDCLRKALGGQAVSMLRVEGEDGEVKLVVLCARDEMAAAVSRAATEAMGDPSEVERWEVPG